jgi:hypothetical protein
MHPELPAPVARSLRRSRVWQTRGRRRRAPVPYFAAALDLRRDSRLILMNPKERIRELAHPDPLDPLAGCYYVGQVKSTELWPFYLLWEDDRLTLLGPPGLQPPRNAFWRGYFGGDASVR